MKKVEIKITNETDDVQLYDVSHLLQPVTQISEEDSYRYNIMCARATLYPNKSIEEVKMIIEDTLNNKNK